jgi:hypothetical protein
MMLLLSPQAPSPVDVYPPVTGVCRNRSNRHLSGTTFEIAGNEVHVVSRLSFVFVRRRFLVKPCDQNIKRTLTLTQLMIELADQGDADREDTGCGVLYGVLRDAAYKIRQLAEQEKGRHQAKGWWDAQCPSDCSPGGSPAKDS